LFENGAAVDGASRRAGEVDMSGFDVAILIGIVALVIWVEEFRRVRAGTPSGAARPAGGVDVTRRITSENTGN
jgi:hypothetical protein